MKKILLLITPIENSINIETVKQTPKTIGSLPPLGLLYIAGYLRDKFKGSVDIKIYNASNKSYDKLKEYVTEYKPDIIGISSFTHSLLDTIKTSKIMRNLFPNSLICIGGPHANDFPNELMSLNICDVIISLGGEIVFYEMADSFLNKKDLIKVKGIYLKRNNSWIFTGERKKNEMKIDDLPYPAIDLYDYKMNSYILDCKSPMTTMMTTKGCRNNCLFCNTPRGIEIRKIDSIIKEILFYKSYGIKEIYFIDDTFNMTDTRLKDFSSALIKNKIKISWSCRLRADKITLEDVRLARKAGCHTIYFGVETSTDEGLKSINKNVTVKQIEEAFYITRKAGIRTMGYFMIGLPFEKNIKDIYSTLNFAKRLKCDFALFNIFIPFPKTYLYNKAVEKGIIDDLSWKSFLLGKDESFIPPVWSENFTKQELLETLKDINRKFYLNFAYVIRFLSNFNNYRFPMRKIKALLGL